MDGLDGIDLFLMIILLIPVYGVLIWSYIEPKESYLFGRRWMYKEDPEFTEETTRFIKRSAMISIIIITLIVILTIYRSFS